MIEGLEDIDFHIISVIGNQNVEILYDLPPNVKSLYAVPLWNIEEPFGYTNGCTIKHAKLKKSKTSEAIIEDKFIPLFIHFLDGIENKNINLFDYALIFSEMNSYFENYDYSNTMLSQPVWETFKKTIYEKYVKYNTIYSNDEIPTLYDLTTCMQWLFHLLIVLNIPIQGLILYIPLLQHLLPFPGIISKLRYKVPFLLTGMGFI